MTIVSKTEWGRLGTALLVGLVVTAFGSWAWVAANYSLDVEMGWLAIPIGVLIGLAVSLGSRRSAAWWAPAMAAGLAIVAMLASQNFLQRELLFDGIGALQAQWSDLKVSDPDADPSSMRPEGAFVVPPPAIIAVMPAPGYELMEAEVLAVVWDDVPADVLAEVRALYPDKIARAEEIIASGEIPDLSVDPEQAAAASTITLEEAQARYEASEDRYDIPKPVAECATPPDFTQPDAQSGLGFGDGVPLVLPLADMIDDPQPRGDGVEYDPPSPWCFGVENAKDQPVETISWLFAIMAAAVVPWKLRRGDDRAGDDSAAALGTLVVAPD